MPWSCAASATDVTPVPVADWKLSQVNSPGAHIRFQQERTHRTQPEELFNSSTQHQPLNAGVYDHLAV